MCVNNITLLEDAGCSYASIHALSGVYFASLQASLNRCHTPNNSQDPHGSLLAEWT